MPEIVPIDDVNLDAAVGLIARGVGEIPLYQWLLGEHVTDQGKCEWLARLLVRPLQRVGCVFGAIDGGHLIAVLVWQPHDVDLSPDGTAPLTPADVAVAVRTPGLRERLLELWTGQPLPLPVDDAVNCVLTVIEPEYRGGSLLFDLVGQVENFCRETNRPFYCWTGSPQVRDWFRDGWGLTIFDTTEWNGHPMYGLVSDRPPRALGGQADLVRRAARDGTKLTKNGGVRIAGVEQAALAGVSAERATPH